jgi:hypothetical protein
LSGFLDKKPDRNRTETGRFGPVPVRFRVSFFSVWVFFSGQNRTEPDLLTPKEDNEKEEMPSSKDVNDECI